MMSLTIFLLSLLGNFVFPITAFSSNIHEKMTSEEIFQTFGTMEVPEYQVFPFALPESRRRRNANEEIKITLELEGKEIDLKLKPSKGQLVSRFTPVWSASTDENSYNKIRYTPLPDAMADIGEFQLYHDLENDAAITVYSDAKHGSLIEGIVTPFYAIKSLPKRLTNEIIKLGDHLVETPLLKRSVDRLNEDESMSYLAVFKIESPSRDVKRSIFLDPLGKHRNKRRTPSRNPGRKVPEAVYPEFLIVLDHNAVRNKTMTEALRFCIAFWNGVDMVYSLLNRPKVYPNIAGIIISADDAATPYIAPDTSRLIKARGVEIPDTIGKYFYKEQIRFPFKHYDMIIGMTRMELCVGKTNPCEQVLGVANFEAACASQAMRKFRQSVLGAGIVHYNWNFGGVDTAIHEVAHIFAVDHDEGDGNLRTKDCDMEEGFAMAAAGIYRNQSFKWSRCSLNDFRTYFSKKESECLDNKPLWMEKYDEVLPGRWLTIDGQCRNDGYDKACEVPKIPMCMVKGCQAKKSTECTITEFATLAGTECGDQMFCNTKSTCVKK